MTPTAANARQSARQMAGRLLRGAARRGGYELVRPGAQPADQPESGEATIPRGQTAPFATEEYDVVPKGMYDIVRRTFYSPVPNLERLPEGIWERRGALGGVDLRVEAAIELIEGELAPSIREFDVPDTLEGPGRFYLHNENYESGDAELLYALIRARKPRRVVELGSGFTTLLIGEAARRNLEDGHEIAHLAYDPYPREQIFGAVPPPPTRFEPLPATEVPLDHFARLEAGDILFVDTTHTVKLGSDVNHIVLDVLPTLAPGVLVHFHDIFLPWEYPRDWFEEMEYYWAEQYLLQAFLAFNSDFEVLIPACAVATEFPARLAEVVPSFEPGRRPGAFWLTRR
jgi:Methyltransferase domain